MKGKIVTMANGITVFRLGLLLVFMAMVVREQKLAAIGLFLAAWGLDGLDGWVARRRGEASELGSLIDKVTDRTILGVGLMFFLVYEYVPWYAIFLAAKDIALVPLLVWREGRVWEGDWSVGWGGKLVSVLQGLGLGWLALGLPWPQVVVVVVAAAGLAAAGLMLADEKRKTARGAVGEIKRA